MWELLPVCSNGMASVMVNCFFPKSGIHETWMTWSREGSKRSIEFRGGRLSKMGWFFRFMS